MVYRVLYQTECLPSPGCAVGLGQARPPEPGEAFVAFPFMQLHALPAVPATTNRPAPPIPPWLKPQPVPVLPQSQPAGFGGAKGLPQTNAPCSSDIQRTLQNLHSNRQHLCVQPGINACWTLTSEMDTILGAVP